MTSNVIAWATLVGILLTAMGTIVLAWSTRRVAKSTSDSLDLQRHELQTVEKQLELGQQQTRATQDQLHLATRQFEATRQAAFAGVKPLLWIHSQVYEDLKSVRLLNQGLGPAIVKRAEFKRGDRSTNNIVELFGLKIVRPDQSEQRPLWKTFINLPARRAIPAQSEVVLVKQSLEHLVGQGIDEQTAPELLREWQAQRSGIRVRIEYKDIFGNDMDPLIYVLGQSVQPDQDFSWMEDSDD